MSTPGNRAARWATVGLVVLVASWELWVRAADVKPSLTIEPSRIATEIADNPGFWLEQTWLTAWHTAVGIAIALLVALLLGAALAAIRPLEWATHPLLVLIAVTPWVAYITSVVVLVGNGTPTVLFMVALVTLPPLVFATVHGLRSADPAALEVFGSIDASTFDVFRKLRLPSSLPGLFTALRFTSTLGLAAAYFAEGGSVVSGRGGLGEAGRRAANNTATGYPILWGTIVCAALLGVLFLVLVDVVSSRLLRWHASQRDRPVA